MADINSYLKIDAKYTVESLVKIGLILKNDKKYTIYPGQREKVKGIIKDINKMKSA